MIETNEYVEYDEDLRFYYLTEAGVIKYVLAGDTLAEMWNMNTDGAKKRAYLQGKLLAQEYKKSAYNGKPLRYRHKDIVEYRIYKNEYGERESIIEALTNFAEVVADSDLDREILMGTKKMPASVLQPLVDSGVYFRGQYRYVVPEDEYRVDY